ncbi:MAG: hypothetical protein COZ43_05360 [Sphingomonadales bacterium CG_4_10_14_3_um_filter_58_15]|nr:MAG: hypothetical protein COZ43_05360 [Sphingomonadales bacterium CG_4_10_14_3_um_filter_58_15]
MDMNFPHQNRKCIAGEDGADGHAHFADHQALLKRAIARQASSQSAQEFGVASQSRRGIKDAARSSFMDERMAFFAGRFRSDLSDRRAPTLFKTGCFRPDLAQRESDNMHN